MMRISLAPMIDKTEPRFRYFIRQLFPEMWLYTEMLSSGAIIHGDPQRFLGLHPCETPVALQLGCHCPEEAYQAVVVARKYGCQQGFSFAEYNLNAGCPSDRVQNRNIGAILMNDGPLVAEILAAMQQAVRDTQSPHPHQFRPLITLKQRLGIEQPSRSIQLTSPEQLYGFVEQVAPHCDRLIVHARIAILDGLNPQQNREVPPLNYPLVLQLKQDFAPLPVELNGGLKNYAQIAAVWPQVDGVMLGRVSYEDTWELFRIRTQMLAKGLLQHNQNGGFPYPQTGPQTGESGIGSLPKFPKLPGVCSRSELVALYADYLEQQPSQQSIAAQIWPLLTLWHGLPEARCWRRMLSPPYPAEFQRYPNSQAVVLLARRAWEFIQVLEQKYGPVESDQTDL